MAKLAPQEKLTTRSSTAHSAVAWIIAVAANVSHARIVQPLVLELPSVHVLDAPEASCGDGGGLRARRHGHGCGGAVGHCGEGAEEFGQE
jgi:hypothetical protein